MVFEDKVKLEDKYLKIADASSTYATTQAMNDNDEALQANIDDVRDYVESNYIASDNLKTINGQSIIGTGDISISGGSEGPIEGVTLDTLNSSANGWYNIFKEILTKIENGTLDQNKVYLANDRYLITSNQYSDPSTGYDNRWKVSAFGVYSGDYATTNSYYTSSDIPMFMSFTSYAIPNFVIKSVADNTYATKTELSNCLTHTISSDITFDTNANGNVSIKNYDGTSKFGFNDEGTPCLVNPSSRTIAVATDELDGNYYNYTFPAKEGTVALTSDIPTPFQLYVHTIAVRGSTDASATLVFTAFRQVQTKFTAITFSSAYSNMYFQASGYQNGKHVIALAFFSEISKSAGRQNTKS